MEMGYRIVNPYPYYGEDITKNRVNFDKHDPLLGWSGVPEAKGWIYTRNSRVYFENNSLGFRDIEHDASSTKPAIVFMGGSYVWGYETRTEKIFVTLLRDELPEYEIFNLSNVCYGNDQELLLFQNWQNKYDGQIKFVILLFTDCDVERNSSNMQCERWKPKFEIRNDKLVLTGVPVPNIGEWQNENVPVSNRTDQQVYKDTWRARVKSIMFNSYFLHALYDRYLHIEYDSPTINEKKDEKVKPYETKEEDLILTSMILEEIDKIVKARGAKLVVFFVPSSLNGKVESNYHFEISKLCDNLGIESFDLNPYFEKAWWRTYTRDGEHWNDYGNKIAAEAIYDLLKNEETFDLRLNHAGSN
jgi:hypothetical protein